jgi:tetratricopeptide (TPR) repeat protein
MAAAGEIAGTGLAIARQLGELPAEAGFVTVLGHVALAREDFATAGDYFERGRELGEQTNFDSMVAVALHNLGSVAFGSGDLELSAARYREALSIYSASGSEYGIALSELYLGLVAVEAGEYEDAAGCLGRALHTFRQMRFPQYASQCLDGIAAVVRARGDASEAVRLTAAADAVRSRTGQAPTVAARRRERELQAARAELSDTVFATAWNEGAALRERDALDRAERAVSG